MESNTKSGSDLASEAMAGRLLNSWEAILAALPANWEAQAPLKGGLRRRRGIHKAEDLLRGGLAYSVLDKSLNELGCWATLQDIAAISAPAWYERLCAAQEWMGWILMQFLVQRRLQLPQTEALNLEIRDATVISRPGSTGTDWRIHLNLDLARMSIQDVALTDAKGGESLVRFASRADRIVLADRIHAHLNGLKSLLACQASFVVRLTWSNLPLVDEQGQAWHLTDWLASAFREPHTVCQEQSVYLRDDEHTGVRVCAVRLAPEAAAAAVRRARAQAKKNHHTPDERTLLAAQFVIVVTNLPLSLWTTEQVLDLYRVRWQVELFFKRLKSILFLDHLRARKSALAKTYLLGKLLAACLLDCLTQRFLQSLPAGYSTRQRPLSFWPLISQLWELFQALIRGPLSPDAFFANPQKLQRFLCTPPRKRRQQLADVQFRLDSLSPRSPLLLSSGLS